MNPGLHQEALRYVHENCGHVPEVKTRPQNTDCITRRIILDYIPLSKGAC